MTNKVTLLDGSTKEFETWGDYLKERRSLTLHSHNDKPAVVRYWDSGSVFSEGWCKKDKLHREGNKPAYIIFNRDRSIYYQYWYKEGKEITEEEAKVYQPIATQPTTSNKCHCDMSTIMRHGCQCGGD